MLCLQLGRPENSGLVHEEKIENDFVMEKIGSTGVTKNYLFE